MHKLVALTASFLICTAANAASDPAPIRLAYNYCTLSYTFAYYGDKEWTAEIDRIARKGYNVATVMDYANRDYPELIRDYYLPRWKKFFEAAK